MTADSSQQQTNNPASKEDKERSFFDMVTAYQDAIFRFLYFRVSNRAVALDITQDTFTKTWLYLSQGKTIQHEEAFLYRTAKNALIDYYKKAKSSSLDAMMDNGFDPGNDAATEELLKEDDIQTVRGLLDTLDEDSRQIIYLRYSEEKPIEEIAEIYGKSVNAMTVQIHRIVKKLRGRYNETTHDGN
jgi:RNA polymerase sigma-70 factor, ECF subfamily